ncbi:MAG: HAD family phosphatase [Gammaproteobacteria bacterium]|nr:HAD family phosphatase [Gammaproteobacteria bacterium]
MATCFCFDLDGTLTKQELLPLIAASVDLEDEISVLTKATIDGFLPFDKSFKLRIRLLKDAPLNAIHQFVCNVECDEAILRFVQQNAADCYVVTGNLDIWVQPLLEQIGVEFFASKAKMDNGQLAGVEHVLHKGDAITELRQRYDNIIVIGEGMNDVPMFELADWRIAYGGVHRPNGSLKELSDFVVYDGEALCRLLNMLS